MTIDRGTLYEAYFDFNDFSLATKDYERVVDMVHAAFKGGDDTAEDYDSPACIAARFISPSKQRVDALCHRVNRYVSSKAVLARTKKGTAT